MECSTLLQLMMCAILQISFACALIMRAAAGGHLLVIKLYRLQIFIYKDSPALKRALCIYKNRTKKLPTTKLPLEVIIKFSPTLSYKKNLGAGTLVALAVECQHIVYSARYSLATLVSSVPRERAAGRSALIY